MARMLNSTDEQTENFRKVENYKKNQMGRLGMKIILSELKNPFNRLNSSLDITYPKQNKYKEI